MLKISYAASLCQTQLISAHITLEMCLTAQNHQKTHTNPFFGIQGHPRSLNSMAIERQCMPSY